MREDCGYHHRPRENRQRPSPCTHHYNKVRKEAGNESSVPSPSTLYPFVLCNRTAPGGRSDRKVGARSCDSSRCDCAITFLSLCGYVRIVRYGTTLFAGGNVSGCRTVVILFGSTFGNGNGRRRCILSFAIHDSRPSQGTF